MVSDEDLLRLSVRTGRHLLAAGARLATAESCTAGWVAKVLTDITGSSDWFDSGYVCYSNAAKQRDLGVGAATLERQGAVSEPAVREMASGALERTGADIAVAISGIAGPTGAAVRQAGGHRVVRAGASPRAGRRGQHAREVLQG